MTALASIILIGCLGVLLILLKLSGFLAWSWWWVTSPFWMCYGALFIALAAILLSIIVGRKQ